MTNGASATSIEQGEPFVPNTLFRIPIRGNALHAGYTGFLKCL